MKELDPPPRPALKDIPNSTKWNKTLTKCQVVNELSEDIKVTYQVTSEGGGGLVSARDFVLVVKQGYKGKDYLQAGCSIEHPDVPKDKKIVRAWNGPGGQLVREIPGESDKCEIYWLMDCEYNVIYLCHVVNLVYTYSTRSIVRIPAIVYIRLQRTYF